MAAILFFVGLFVQNKVSDIDFLKTLIKDKTKLELYSDGINAKYSFLSINLRTKNLSIKEPGAVEPLIELNNSYVKIKILPLLFGKISISEFVSDDVVVSVKRLEDGTFNFSKYINNDKTFLKADLSSIKTNLLKYKINICDLISGNQFLFNGKELAADGLDVNKKINIKTNGDFVVLSGNSVKVSPYLIDIDFLKHNNKIKLKKQEIVLSSFDLSFLKNYFKDYDFKNFDAIVDIHSTKTDDNFFRVYLYLNNLNIGFDYKNELNTLISKKPIVNEMDFKFQDNNLVIKKGNLVADDINILYSGKIKNILDINKIEPDIEVAIKNTNAYNLAKILPDTLIPMKEPYIKNIKKYNVNGFADGKLQIKYRSRDDFSVKGKVDFIDVYVKERPKNAKTAFGNCEFLGRDVLINVYVPAPNDSILTVFGKSKMQKDPVGNFDIKSHGKLDMEFAHKILMPVKELLGLKLGPFPYMTLKGNGEIDLKTNGTKEKANLNGYFVTNDATVTLNGLNTVLKNGKVKVEFSGDKILFNGATGIIEGAQTQIDGSSSTNGDMDIKVNVKNAPAKNALKIAQTSPIVLSSLDGGEFLNSFKADSGNIDFYLNIYGNVPPDAVFGERSDSVYAKGKINFKGNSVTILPAIKGTNLKGELTFQNSCDFKLNADIFDSPFVITGSVAQKGAKGRVLHGVPSTLTLKLKSDNLKSSSVGKFILDNLELFIPQNRAFTKNLGNIFSTNKFKLKADVTASGFVYSNAKALDLSGFDFSGFVQGINSNDSDAKFKSGNITLKGKNAKFNNLRTLISGVDFLLDGNIDKFASKKPFNNLSVTFFESSFKSYFDLFSKLIPEKQRQTLSNFSDFKGNISGKIKLYSDKINGEIIPNNLSFKDNKTGNIVSLKDGKIALKNNKTYLKDFNVLYGNMPIYIDGYSETTGSVNPEFNIYTTFNLNEEICDRILNPYLKYPLSLNGEALFKGRILGKLNSYTTYANVILDKDSDMSFMGVTLGDINSKREIASKIKFDGNLANVDYIKYFKHIDKQNHDILKVSGGVRLLKDNNLEFKNFKILTLNPAPVRLINILFKRSIIKEGTFNSNLVLNGSLNDIKANGSLVFKNVVLPIYDSVIENIHVDLKEKEGIASFKISLHDTLIDTIIDFENKLTLPVVINDITIHSDYISIGNLMKLFVNFADSASKLSNTPHSTQTQNVTLTPSDIQIKRGAVLVDKITFNEVDANNLKIKFSHSPKESSLKINDAYLGIAGGLFKGNGIYRFDTKDITMNADFINCDANMLTKAFFNLSDEIFGNANGSFKISMKDYTTSDYVQKINASANFEILNGRMPRLGSIEYLLKASNVLRGGILNLTLNNVIELLKPYRQGDFNKISGNFIVKDAMVQDLKIYSQGDDLSTYTSGTYNIKTGISEIEILGKLSKNVSNLLGTVGNASIVSVLNAITRNKINEMAKGDILKNIAKIPFIDINDNQYRIFNARLEGEVSKTNAVKSFTWVN